MTANNESQGLKIAVAAFLTTSVILAVALYFVYSAYTSAEARLDAALTENKQLIKTQSLLQTQYDEVKRQMGKAPESRPE